MYAGQGSKWVVKKYGDKINKRVVAQDYDASMIDYEVANRVLSFEGTTDDSDLDNVLTNDFDANIPCLTDADPSQIDSSVLAMRSAAAKFIVPTEGISNLSVWTTIRPHQTGVGDIDSGATKFPRAEFTEGRNTPDPFNAWDSLDNATALKAKVWLRELAPPLFEGWSRKIDFDDADRDSFQFGIIDEQAYGSNFGLDKDRILIDYQKLSEDAFDLARG